MGRYTGAVCKLCRRDGKKLFLKGLRCNTEHCSLKKRDTPPGQHSWRKGKLSEYGQRLREKQKLKRHYGIFEAQFKRYFEKAEQMKGNTGENLLNLLERRIDTVLWRSQFALSLKHARQIVHHGHIKINGKKVNIPSYVVKTGDHVEFRDKVHSQKIIKTIVEKATFDKVPSWLSISKEPPVITVAQMPTRSEVPLEIKENAIVEFCSR